MASELNLHGRYGKTKVRVFVVRKNGPKQEWHDVLEVDVQCLLEGDINTSYTLGDNTVVVPTDTVKNTCYVIAKKMGDDLNWTIEDYGMAIVKHFLGRHKHINKVTVDMSEKLWQRLTADGQPHEHAFSAHGPERKVSRVVGSRDGQWFVQSGITDLKVMKTTQSGFENYVVDEYTTLQPASDRIFCTNVDARWIYSGREQDLPVGRFGELFNKVRTTMLRVFTGPAKGGAYSKSVQETMYVMATEALKETPLMRSVTLVLPNIHHITFDLKRFGLENSNQIFYPTDDPSGLIECTVSRPVHSKM